MKSIASVILLLTASFYALAQPRKLIDSSGIFYAGAGAGILIFRGDEALQKIASGSVGPHISAGYQWRQYNAELRLLNGTVNCMSNGTGSLDNFKSKLNAADIQFFFNKKIKAGSKDLTWFAGLGFGFIQFDSYSDLKDRNGQNYISWSDGTLRDLPELKSNQFKSNIIQRDFTYETPLAINHKSLYIPFSSGIRIGLSPRITSSFLIESILLQTDQMDRNSSNVKNDKLLRLSLSLAWQFSGKPAKKEKIAIKKEEPYSKTEFSFLETDDEDKDGIPDIRDLCFNTPPGVAVGLDGCPADGDLDGVFDYQDKELNSPKNAWVSQDGIAFTDDDIRSRYNDSIAWFVSALRKFNKNSRPYPVKKFIPDQQYETFARMLEIHPEWRIIVEGAVDDLPKKFKSIDLNNDRILSMKELEIALINIFENKKGSISLPLLREAIKYAFEVQN